MVTSAGYVPDWNSSGLLARRLRIAVTADPELPVPPREYGGIERIIAMLVSGLVARGHHVTLFAHPASSVPCQLEPYPQSPLGGLHQVIANMMHVSRKVLNGQFDLVHSFGRLAYLGPLLPLTLPKIMSYQRSVTTRSVRVGSFFGGCSLRFTSCSASLIREVPFPERWCVIYNAAPAQSYTFRPEVPRNAPLVFLGRVERIKGPHVAIEVAKQTGRPLIIAGNVPSSADHQRFFSEHIAPVVDGDLVHYVGPVDDCQKDQLLGQAACMLMPVLWEEPFGIVMAEALACGTPVLGFARGAVPEVIEHGINGLLCSSTNDMAEAVRRIHTISRAGCRESFERRFSDSVLVDQYESLYYACLSKDLPCAPVH